jgi:hypothetical protein
MEIFIDGHEHATKLQTLKRVHVIWVLGVQHLIFPKRSLFHTFACIAELGCALVRTHAFHICYSEYWVNDSIKFQRDFTKRRCSLSIHAGWNFKQIDFVLVKLYPNGSAHGVVRGTSRSTHVFRPCASVRSTVPYTRAHTVTLGRTVRRPYITEKTPARPATVQNWLWNFLDVLSFSNKRVRKNFKSTSTVLSKYFRKYCRSTSKVLSKYFGSFYDLPEIKLAEASIFLLKDFSQISKKR